MLKTTLGILLAFSLMVAETKGQGVPDISRLDYETKSSIEIACVVAKTNGPARYARCINEQLASLGISPNQSQQRRYVVPSTPRRKIPPPTLKQRPQPRVAEQTPKKSYQPNSSTTGSGFFISIYGHIVTNQHVVNECSRITVGDNAKKQVAAEIVEADKKNDLALLKLSLNEMASTETKSLIRKLGIRIQARNIPLSSNGLLRSEDVELGERVMVSGYPYGEIFSDTIKVTGGMVSAVRGMGDDSGQFQIDAAVQPGNSGGPIYDENGNIVGVVISQLNKLKVAKAIGSLPENVNFGIKASTVRQFLSSAGLPTKWSDQTHMMSSRDLAKIAKNQTLMVVCHQ